MRSSEYTRAWHDMSDEVENSAADWGLGDWEQALTIKVGTTYVCGLCGNVAMVTRSGVGMMEMTCCGQAMEREPDSDDSASEGRRS